MDSEDDLVQQVAADTVLQPKEKYSDAYFSRKSVVYFVAAGKDPIKAVKIGVTARDTVRKRLVSIQSSNHERVYLLGVQEFLDDDKPGLQAERAETDLHRKFAPLRRAKPWTVGAEWFSWDNSLETYIATLPPLPDDLQPLTLGLSPTM